MSWRPSPSYKLKQQSQPKSQRVVPVAAYDPRQADAAAMKIQHAYAPPVRNRFADSIQSILDADHFSNPELLRIAHEMLLAAHKQHTEADVWAHPTHHLPDANLTGCMVFMQDASRRMQPNSLLQAKLAFLERQGPAQPHSEQALAQALKRDLVQAAADFHPSNRL